MAKKNSGDGKYNIPVKLNPGKPLEDAQKGFEVKRVWIDDKDGIISENGRSNK